MTRHAINIAGLTTPAFGFVATLMLAACGGGSDGATTLPEPIDDNCGLTSVLENGACRQFAIRVDEQAATPFTENGQPVSLEIVRLMPLTGSRIPTVVFHHGSTGDGSDPSLFGITFTSKAIARYFVENGWMVVFPQRRGRGMSGGLYDEGFNPVRSAYSCEQNASLAGAARALQDLDVITDWVRNHPNADTTRLLVGGTSRGGILSIAHSAARPDTYLGAINFVGGWVAEGCGDHQAINQSLFTDGAVFPGTSLWLYGERDTFYSIIYSRGHFDAFSAAGGMGSWNVLGRAPALNGHFLINDLDLWRPVLDAYLAELE